MVAYKSVNAYVALSGLWDFTLFEHPIYLFQKSKTGNLKHEFIIY